MYSGVNNYGINNYNPSSYNYPTSTFIPLKGDFTYQLASNQLSKVLSGNTNIPNLLYGMISEFLSGETDITENIIERDRFDKYLYTFIYNITQQTNPNINPIDELYIPKYVVEEVNVTKIKNPNSSIIKEEQKKKKKLIE